MSALLDGHQEVSPLVLWEGEVLTIVHAKQETGHYYPIAQHWRCRIRVVPDGLACDVGMPNVEGDYHWWSAADVGEPGCERIYRAALLEVARSGKGIGEFCTLRPTPPSGNRLAPAKEQKTTDAAANGAGVVKSRASTVDRLVTADMIREFLTEHGYATKDQIAAALGHRPQRVQRLLYQLERLNEARRERRNVRDQAGRNVLKVVWCIERAQKAAEGAALDFRAEVKSGTLRARVLLVLARRGPKTVAQLVREIGRAREDDVLDACEELASLGVIDDGLAGTYALNKRVPGINTEADIS